MSGVLLDMAISLDGYINGEGLHDWYFSPAPPSAAVIDELVKGLGAIIMGGRAFREGLQAGGFADDPYDAVRYVLSHNAPRIKPDIGKPFLYVNDGIESALRQARVAAKGRQVCIGGGANVAQQYLKAGLVDEIQLHLVPIVLGGGLRLFDDFMMVSMKLEITRVVASVGVTHLKYRVVK